MENSEVGSRKSTQEKLPNVCITLPAGRQVWNVEGREMRRIGEEERKKRKT